MADFLASFNFDAAEDEPFRDEACSSLDDLQSRFRDAFDGKITETRAERVKLSVDIGPSTQFTIFSDQGDDVDPSLSRVSARDALVTQPQETPTLQRAVSQQILNTIGSIDGSTWSMTEEDRKAQGWVFTCACNHSWQQWTRHGKGAQMQAILDYSQKELDFTSRARPAFDCRGLATISFSKGNSAISIGYSHTPFHRTVGEVYDLFKPPPPPPRAVSKKKAPGSAKKSATPRRKRAATDADGEPAPKKPRSRPRKGAKNQLSQAELVPITEGFTPTDANGTTAIDAADHVALAALSAATAAAILPDTGAKPTPKNNTASLNVSPEEATRRRETATKKLTEAGIDPATLNVDQFSIFSNQSPEVQAESLNMLVKYGAERLHIVHPAKKDRPRPAPSHPEAETIASGSVNPNHLAHDSAGESVGADVSVVEANGTSETPRKGGKKGSKSRVFCFNCKLSKSKCSKEKPTCTACLESGLTCEYPLPKPRSRNSAAIITEDDDTMISENLDAEGEAEDSRTEDVQTQEAIQTQAETHYQPLVYNPVPIANMMEITPDDEGNGSRPMGDASLQSTTYENPAPTSSVNGSSGGLALPQGHVYYPDATAVTKEPLPNNASTVVETTNTRRSQRPPKPSAKVESRVPTPAQAFIISSPRERHESPLERHNPRRHEAQPRNPLTFDQSPSNPYGQPATQSQYPSDPYRQIASYGQSQGAYPQLQDTATERIAYDPNAFRNPANAAPARSFSQQEPPAPARANAAKPSWPSRGRDVAAADTLQRIHGYTGARNSNAGNTMLPVHPQNQRRSLGGNGNVGNVDGTHGVMSASKRSAASRKSDSSQTTQQQHHQAPVATNQTQHGQQQTWYGFEGLHGSSTTTTHSGNGWGGSGGSGWN